MRMIARTLPLALVTLVGLPLAQAERPYQSSRPELNQSDRPTPEPVVREHTHRDPSSVRPDANGKSLVTPAVEGDARGVVSNVEIRHGKPDIRPNATRDAFMPVDENGKMRALTPNVEVKKGKPNVRPEPTRDAFIPARDDGSHQSPIRQNVETAKGKPALRPDAKRDAFMPVDDQGRPRGLEATGATGKGRPAMLRPAVCQIADCE